jgi:hypothetical protein
MIGYSSGKILSKLLATSGLRLGFTFIIALTVLSSSFIVIIDNPALASTLPQSPSSSGPTELEVPSTISQDGGGDFTAQAPLQIPRTFQSTDIVNSVGIYEVTFITSTTGAIDKIEMVFPAGTGIGPAGVIEKIGIGGGVLTKAGTTLTYDVTTPVSIPAGTFIRLEISGVKNPGTSSTFTATLTTRDSGGAIIDGPTVTNAYNIKQIGTGDIANNAVTTPKISDGSITSSKPAESFMKRVTLNDTPAGNALGWNPDGIATDFLITQNGVLDSTFISISLNNGDTVCGVDDYAFGLDPPAFFIKCTSAPPEFSELHYVVENLPENVNS